jgi:hypothetical protein
MDSTRDRYGDDFGGEQMWGLKELAYPDAIPFWPQTAGWLVVGILLLALLGWFAWRLRRRWLHNAYRREALSSIAAMDADPTLAKRLPFILRRSALAAYDRSVVASLRGADWVHWLNETAEREVFKPDAADTLDRLAYSNADVSRGEIEPLLAASRDWLRHHRA